MRGAELVLARSKLVSPAEAWKAEGQQRQGASGHVAVVHAQDVVGLSWLEKLLINFFGM